MSNRICPNCKGKFQHYYLICPYCPGTVATIMKCELDCYTDLFDGNPPPRPNSAIAEFTAGMILNPNIHTALYQGRNYPLCRICKRPVGTQDTGEPVTCMDCMTDEPADVAAWKMPPEYFNPYEPFESDLKPKPVAAPPIRQPKPRFRLRHLAGILLGHLLVVCILEACLLHPIERIRQAIVQLIHLEKP